MFNTRSSFFTIWMTHRADSRQKDSTVAAGSVFVVVEVFELFNVREDKAPRFEWEDYGGGGESSKRTIWTPALRHRSTSLAVDTLDSATRAHSSSASVVLSSNVPLQSIALQ